ncbi:hypothetical protein V6R21_05855 [Limibacter armeniacum]|uniref:hypothetical protein n=1 Tax=Limibacter armeniacum TaxID=466084 RepID=UPI002FE60549
MRKVYTPHTPHYKKVMLTVGLVISFISTSSWAQISVVSVDSLSASVMEYYHRKMAAEQEEFLYLERGKWMKYMPTVGFSFGLPSVSWGTGKVYEARQATQVKTVKLSAIKAVNELEMNALLQEVMIDHQTLIGELEHHQVLEEILQLEEKLFAIVKEAYEKHEITPMELLLKQKQLLTEKEKVAISLRKMLLLRAELYKKARYQLPKIRLETEGEKLAAER